MVAVLTAEQLADKLPLHPETIRRWAREGRIPHRRLGGRRVVFIESEVNDWLVSSGILTESVMPPNLERKAA